MVKNKVGVRINISTVRDVAIFQNKVIYCNTDIDTIC